MIPISESPTAAAPVNTSTSQSTNEAAEWNAFVVQHAAGHLLQTSDWGALKSRFGWSSEIVLARAGDGSVEGGAQLLIRPLHEAGPLGLSIGYVPRGPVVDWHNRGTVERTLAAIEARCRTRGVSVLKIEPQLDDTLANRRRLAALGLRPSRQSVQPRSSVVLPLDGDEAALLARMKSKWRYNVRLSARKNVTVREMTRADLPTFHALMQTTSERDDFAVHSSAYYEAAFDLLVPQRAVFLLAEHAGDPLAAIVVCTAGETAWYLWGASSNRERNRMPNHALQWTGMQWARSRGARRYDFWGVPDAIGQLAVAMQRGTGAPAVSALDLPVDSGNLPEGELWGVWRFKQGFGGHVTRTVGAWDKPIEPLGAKIYTFGLAARQIVRDSLSTIRHSPFSTLINGERLTVNGESRTEPRGGDNDGVEIVEREEEWNGVLSRMPAPHVLQSWTWSTVKGQTGWRADRLAVRAGKTLAAAQFLWREPIRVPVIGDAVARLLPLRVGYVPKGPLLDWSNEAAVEATLVAIEAQARRRGCLLIKIDPDVREDSDIGRAVTARLQTRGWQRSDAPVQFKNTAFSYLTADKESSGNSNEVPLDDETLLGAMKSKWRYNVRLAGRRGINVRQGTAADFANFYALYSETAARDGFLIRPYSYYERVWSAFLADEHAADGPSGGVLLLAEHADEATPVAGVFLVRYGARAWYLYGASSERRRRDMPTYLLQWQSMRWARDRGCAIYDWWGAPTDLADESDSMQGVWRFKQGFGAEFQSHIGAWDFPTAPRLYALYTNVLPRVLDFMRSRT